MSRWDLVTTTRVTSQDIDDLMVSALEGGINYWCFGAELVGSWPEGEKDATLAELVSKGCTIKLWDDAKRAPTSQPLYLGLEGVLDAIGRAAELRSKSIRAFIDEHDACDADVVVQYAVFGELIYE